MKVWASPIADDACHGEPEWIIMLDFLRRID